MNELRTILDELAAVCEDDEPSVMATVVQVLGSSYRGIGARCLIERDGRAIGLVSGGCLEADIARQAWRLTACGEAALIRYDSTSPSGEWTFGLGCRGVIDILLERIEGPRPAALIDFLLTRLDRHEPAVLARVLRVGPGDERAKLGSFLALGSDGATCHDLRSPGLAAEVATAARGVLVAGRSGHVTLAGPGDGIAAVLELVEPPPTLIICGAGPDALPLVRLARELGWYVAVVDGRARSSTRERFAAADEVATLADADRIHALARRPMAAVVIMTHNVVEDSKFLDLLFPTPVGYIGLLGPRHRASRVLNGLGLLDANSRARLHAPIGLDLGADTPAEIALAIVAEIRAAIAGRSGGRLRDRLEPIHDRLGTSAAAVTVEVGA
jgi:xanthine dehydrogenase accessory factor